MSYQMFSNPKCIQKMPQVSKAVRSTIKKYKEVESHSNEKGLQCSQKGLHLVQAMATLWHFNSKSFDKGSISNTSSNHLIFCRPLHLLPLIFPAEMRWLDNIKLNGQELEQIPGNGGGQGSLECCSSWGHKESDTTE